MNETKYKIVSANTMSELEKKVNHCIEKGWRVSILSEISFHDGKYHKEMLKNIKKELLKG